MNKKSEKKQATIAIANDINDTSKDLLSVEKSAGVNTYKYGPHYVDTANDIHGIGELLESILESFGCVHDSGIEHTTQRETAIEHSMFMHELQTAVEDAFASAGKRYPNVSLRVYLSNHKRGYVFESIQLTSAEDSTRTCPRPRCKYYWSNAAKAVRQDIKSA